MEKPVTLDAPLTSLPGIGPQRAALFARLNVRTVGELLRLYPRTYEDRTRLVSIASLEAGTPACFEAAVVTTPRTNRIPKPGSRVLEVVFCCSRQGGSPVKKSSTDTCCLTLPLKLEKWQEDRLAKRFEIARQL